MTALQSILKEAKALKKSFPKRFKKWTDYVKQASAIYAGKHKGKSPVGKKKKAAKKTVKKSIIKKTAVKKVARKKPSEKDVLKSIKHAEMVQKSHMGGVRHMNGLNPKIMQRLKDITDEIEKREDVLASVMHRKKDLIAKNGKQWYNKFIKQAKGYISECKKHKSELKRFI